MSTTEALQQRSSAVVQTIRENAPNQRQVIGLVTLLTGGLLLLVVGGLTLTGTAIAVTLLTPVFIFFSPVLIPLGIVLFLAVAGFLSAGGFGFATFSGTSWLYKYLKGQHPAGSDRVDAAKGRIADTASHLKERALGYTSDVQSYLHSSKDQVLSAAPGT